MNRLIISFMLCFFLAACNKEKLVWEEVYFEFEMPFTITPNRDTVSVGEVLRIQAQFSDSLYDLRTKKKYYLPDFNFKIIAGVNELINPLNKIYDQPSAVNSFTIIDNRNQITSATATYINFYLIYQSGQYWLDIILVPKKKGVYAIQLFNAGEPGGGYLKLPQSLAPSEPGIKRFPVAQQHRYLFNEGNSNYEIFKANCLPFKGTIDTLWEKRATYTFVVK
ncbi:MAG TPA: hypothetical protein VLC98_09035 [Phnomibacter sp.]|nr:hypothetical protein [Phnomibacter sp.]